MARRPRPSPNPNVLLEHGYALACLGDERLIGVMNSGTGGRAELLPFDLKHRRWPINYELTMPIPYVPGQQERFKQRRLKQRKALVSVLEVALRDALDAPLQPVGGHTVDLSVATSLWATISSEWMQNWVSHRLNYPQYEEEENISTMQSYRRLACRPESVFKDKTLRDTHAAVVNAITDYLGQTALAMVPHSEGQYFIKTKAGRWHENYDKDYEREIGMVESGARRISLCWDEYIDALRARHPIVAFPRPD